MNVVVEHYITELFIQEDISLIAKKIDSKKGSIILALKTQKVDKIKAALSFLPKIPIDKIYEYARKIPGFDLEYERVIEKMTGTPEERQIKAIALAFLYAVKKNIKDSRIQKALSNFKVDYHSQFIARDVFTALCLLGSVYLVMLTISGFGNLVLSGASSIYSVVAGAVAATGAALSAFSSGFIIYLVIVFVIIVAVLTIVGNISSGANE